MAENRKAALGFIFITLLLDVIGFGIIISVLPTLIRELIGGTLSEAAHVCMYEFGWNEAWVGYSLGAVGTMTVLVQGLLIRIINPRLEAKRSVLLGMTLCAVGFTLFG